jgi:hypothetical protein
MKRTILIAACILSATAIYISYKHQTIKQTSPFTIHSVERDGRITAVIPIGKGKNLNLFGNKDGDHVTITDLMYTLDGKMVFSHTDQFKDGIPDELEYREPPFTDMRLYTLNQDGSYSRASQQRYDEVVKMEQIYDEAAKEAFSATTKGSDEFNKVYEKAHEKVRALSETQRTEQAAPSNR